MVKLFCQLVSAESWPQNGMNQACNSQRPSTQKPACFTTESPLIPIKTIPNHSWDVSRAFVMIEKQWYIDVLSVGLLHIMMARKWHESSQSLNGPQHKNQPASQQRVH
jgi:hypothetical protein